MSTSLSRVSGVLRRVALFALLALGAWCPLAGVAAQEGAAVSDPTPKASLSAEEIDGLIATLEDGTQREALLAKLRILRDAQRAGAGPAAASSWDRITATALSELDERSAQLGGQLRALWAVLADIPRTTAWLSAQWSDPLARQALSDVAANVALVVAASLLGYWLVAVSFGRRRDELERRKTEGLAGRLVNQLGAMLLGLAPLVVFALVAYAALALVDPRPSTRLAVLAFVNAALICGAALAALRALLVPSPDAPRTIPVQDETAAYLYVWARRLSIAVVYGYAIAETALLLGAAAGVHRTLLDLVGLLVAGMLIVLIAQNRQVVAGRLRGGPGGEAPGVLRRRLADVWHLVAIAYVVASCFIWLLDIGGGAAFVVRGSVLSVVVVIAAAALFAGARRVMARGFAVGMELRSQFPGLEARANRYISILEKLVHAVIVVVALMALLEVWGLGGFAFLATDVGHRLAASALAIVASVAVAVLVWELVSSAVERRLTETDEDGNLLAKGGRIRTLLPLLRKVAFIVLATVVTLIVLSEIGVNIAPLLAGAGIVGLAVGFGAQALVKDIITGLFILIENTIAVGDVVNVGGHAGLVEAISLRTLTLRDLSGTVHTVPYGSIDTVMNLTKDFSYYVMDVGISYREDTDQVVEILKQIGAEMLEHPTYALQMLEPLEILGVDRFADSAVVIKARLKTKPIKQWMVGREFNRRMKKRFDELDIEIPFPHMTLYFGQDKAGNAPPGHVRLDSPDLVEGFAADRARLESAPR